MNLILQTVLLAAVYLTVVGSITWWDAAIGAAIGAAVAQWTRDRSREHDWTAARLAALPNLAAGAVLEVARGTATMLGVIVGRRTPRRGGLVTVPAPSRTTGGRIVTAFVVTASPGSAVLDIDGRSRQLRLHTIDARDPAAIRGAIARFYARHQRQSVP